MAHELTPQLRTAFIVRGPECKPLFQSQKQIGGTSSTDQRIMDQSHEVSLDINKITTSLRNQLNTKKVFNQGCCIYRVPARLRRLNEEAYTPSVVSIGPIHHGKENLKAMEDHKIRYLQQFLERSKVSVEVLINIVRDNETALRDCYAETTDLSREDFATMILLDAVFVIMVLLLCSPANRESHERGSGDQIFLRPFKIVDVEWDMCLLENQLPFFILEKLLELCGVAVNPKKCTVIELTSQWLQVTMEEWVKEDSWKTINSSEVLHFVDFIRKCQRPTERSSEERETATLSLRAPNVMEWSCKNIVASILGLRGAAPNVMERSCEKTEASILRLSGAAANVMERSCEKTEASISRLSGAASNVMKLCPEDISILSAPPATKLHQSGVKFKNPERKSLFDVSFDKGILEIPQLTIDDHTETIFRNLQAFEQCHHMFEEKFVSDYITFISCLVRAPNDVEVLADNKNLNIMLNSDEAVSKLLYNLDKENVFSIKNNFLIGICEDLNSHCRKRRHKWKANLMQDYFKNPWTAISVAAAAFLLILTVIQTVCSILQVKWR